MDQNDPEVRLIFALQNIHNIKVALETLEKQVQDGLKGLQERKPRKKRAKKDGS